MRYLRLLLVIIFVLSPLVLFRPVHAQTATPTDTPTDTMTPTPTSTATNTPTATPEIRQYVTLQDGQVGAVEYSMDAGEVALIIILLIILGVQIFQVIVMLRPEAKR